MYRVRYHKPVGTGPHKLSGGAYASLQDAVSAVAEFAHSIQESTGVSIYVPGNNTIAWGNISGGRWTSFMAHRDYR